MGKLIKNHWARLIILTAATYQCVASIHGFFWPKVFWDFLTKNLDPAVKPVPILQIFNLLLGIGALAMEWPLPLLSGTFVHRSIEARLIVYPLASLAALLMYQGTNAGLYYLIGVGVYFWAFAEGEVCSLFLRFCETVAHSGLDCLPDAMDIAKEKHCRESMTSFGSPPFFAGNRHLLSTSIQRASERAIIQIPGEMRCFEHYVRHSSNLVLSASDGRQTLHDSEALGQAALIGMILHWECRIYLEVVASRGC